jgi:hypothetical protein
MTPEINIIKYCICWLFEKLHRYAFDNLYICYEDDKYSPLTILRKVILIIYKVLFGIVYKDFREYLRYWSHYHKSKYLRYNNYDT